MQVTIEHGQIRIGGRPFFIRGAELHNSSSHPGFLASRWDQIADLDVNTLLAAVPWDAVEPEPGEFDFDMVDALIQQARSHGLRLVLLWFGSWKNGSSSYVPRWMKLDPSRYRLSQDETGAVMDNLSPFCAENSAADARAFAALLAHVESIDSTDRTVLMVQVENEVGLLGSARDHSAAAEAAYDAPVPAALRATIAGTRGSARVVMDAAADADASWPELFGRGDATDDLFMAWHYASYVEQVAAAGRAVSSLPYLVNAWLDSPPEGASALSGGQRPGEYPSGGPLPHNAASWQVAAPTIDFLAPDVYHGGMPAWAGAYRSVGEVLFIPEMRYDREGIEGIYLAVGEYGAMGTSPFGIDSVIGGGLPSLRRAYRQLAALEQEILEAQVRGSIRGFRASAEDSVIEVGDVRFDVVADPSHDASEPSSGILIHDGASTFTLIGQNIRVLPLAKLNGGRMMVLTAQELVVEGARAVAHRQLNGDETLAGTAIRVASDTSRLFGLIPSSGSVDGSVQFQLYELGAPPTAS